MASPQLEDGYTKIANELLEKISQSDFGGRQVKTLLWVIRFTYGFHEKMMPLNISNLSRGLGMDRSHCRRVVNEMVANKVLTKKKDGKGYLIGINKDWEKWGPECPMGQNPEGGGTKAPHGGGQKRLIGGGRGVPPLKKELHKEILKENKQQLQAPDGAGENPENLPVEIKKPKPPQEHHQDFHRLSFKFYQFRLEYLGDEYFNPWDGKSLTQCKNILEKSSGNLEEAERRARHLALWNRVDPDYWKMTPGNLLSKWADLHEPPAGKHNAAEYAEAKQQAELKKMREDIKNG